MDILILNHFSHFSLPFKKNWVKVMVTVFNATFKNISVIYHGSQLQQYIGSTSHAGRYLQNSISD
jgi:hypothetical protein